MIYMYVGKKNRSNVIFYHRHDLIRKKIDKKSCYTMRNLSQNISLSCFHFNHFFNSLFTIKQIKSHFLENTTMKGKFQICIIVNIQWDTIKNVDVMFGSISHVVRLGLRDYPSVVVLMKMPYLVNMTIWSTLPILNDKWQMI